MKKRTLIMTFLLSLCTLLYVISFSISYSSYKNKIDTLHNINVANFIVNYERLKLTKINGAGFSEDIALNQASNNIIINNIEPEDIIQYQCAISNYKNDNLNQVKTKVTVSFKVYLEENNNKHYVNMSKNYSQGSSDVDEKPLLINSEIKLTKSKNDSVSEELFPNLDNSDILYDLSSITITESDDVYNHQFGFIFDASIKTQYKFVFTFKIPGQNEISDLYERAKYNILIEVDSEQIENVEEGNNE